jgi:hypothetical protein
MILHDQTGAGTHVWTARSYGQQIWVTFIDNSPYLTTPRRIDIKEHASRDAAIAYAREFHRRYGTARPSVAREIVDLGSFDD